MTTSLVLRSTAEIWSESTDPHRAFVPMLLAMAERQERRGAAQPDLFGVTPALSISPAGDKADPAWVGGINPKTPQKEPEQ